ncbi:DUF937 domain-containing protein [Microbacterium fluvii]|uniref:DUF937 domain-containing protein n=1 Tax=Microbacterium fluvii TaxID=415215 RepID=A0ABW2HGB1_9MICO|nr:DUF937 domain-containing protein [Microbacterium fluvii]MCU4673963.1 DUF937 domain-containing protein [Microbacterium fluvii]
MAGLDDILSKLPIDQIAAQLGVDPATAQKAVKEGGATILSGLQHNASTPDGAAALEKALGSHAGTTGAVDLNAVDTADGEKILGHVFGGRQGEVAQKLTDEPKTAGIDFGQLLPMLAPIVMGMLAGKQTGTTQSAAGASTGESGGGIGDLIGGLLGGGSGAKSGGGIDIGGMLGGLFGGGK